MKGDSFFLLLAGGATSAFSASPASPAGAVSVVVGGLGWRGVVAAAVVASVNAAAITSLDGTVLVVGEAVSYTRFQ